MKVFRRAAELFDYTVGTKLGWRNRYYHQVGYILLATLIARKPARNFFVTSLTLLD